MSLGRNFDINCSPEIIGIIGQRERYGWYAKFQGLEFGFHVLGLNFDSNLALLGMQSHYGHYRSTRRRMIEYSQFQGLDFDSHEL